MGNVVVTTSYAHPGSLVDVCGIWFTLIHLFLGSWSEAAGCKPTTFLGSDNPSTNNFWLIKLHIRDNVGWSGLDSIPDVQLQLRIYTLFGLRGILNEFHPVPIPDQNQLLLRWPWLLNDYLIWLTNFRARFFYKDHGTTGTTGTLW